MSDWLYNDSPLKRSGMASVNEGSHRFTLHPHHSHTTAPINHTTASPRKHSPDGAMRVVYIQKFR